MAAPAGQISLEELSVQQLTQVKEQLEEVRVVVTGRLQDSKLILLILLLTHTGAQASHRRLRQP